jgi:hypothetical protein
MKDTTEILRLLEEAKQLIAEGKSVPRYRNELSGMKYVLQDYLQEMGDMLHDLYEDEEDVGAISSRYVITEYLPEFSLGYAQEIKQRLRLDRIDRTVEPLFCDHSASLEMIRFYKGGEAVEMFSHGRANAVRQLINAGSLDEKASLEVAKMVSGKGRY